MSPSLALFERCARRLSSRVDALETRLASGEEAVWPQYVDTVQTLVLVLSNLSPERRGAYLTTAEMAERLSLSPKTLLKHKAHGKIRPALQRGKLIRWKGTEQIVP